MSKTILRDWHFSVALITTILIFLVDLLLPLEISFWLVYLVPLLILASSPKPVPLLRFLPVWVVLVFVDFVIDWKNPHLDVFFLDRIAELIMFSVLIYFLDRRRKTTEDLRKSKEQLEQAAADLRRSNEELEHFAYIASHDLQEPLRTIRSYLQLIEKRYKGQLDKNADEFIAFAVDGAGRMQNLVADLLVYSRAGAANRPLEPVDANTALANALEALKISIEASGAEISHGPLPCLNGDLVQLTQLFQNLISNAIKFRAEGVSPRISVSVVDRGKSWQFFVRDNGIGIDPKYHGKVFTIFQRLHSSDKYPGTGLGLSICQKIVQRHGGEICVESKPGDGSNFIFTLPKSL